METTLEDVKIAIDDISDRVNYLKLLTDDMKTFEGLLEDHNFRLRIVKDNEVISHIVDRTTLALEATFKDIDQGLNAANEFAAYLDNQVNKPWRQQRPQIADTYNAMRGNAEGWHQVLMDIQARATLLDTVLVSLAQIIAELDLSVYIACGTTVTNTLPSDNIRRPETDP
ncbi:hypothetical protein GGS21DRAFT_514339 [Xylaria nigripes]|nr:hypothetical protein GGS21DRAFT_514339 [Xylaria nigripes]